MTLILVYVIRVRGDSGFIYGLFRRLYITIRFVELDLLTVTACVPFNYNTYFSFNASFWYVHIYFVIVLFNVVYIIIIYVSVHCQCSRHYHNLCESTRSNVNC